MNPIAEKIRGLRLKSGMSEKELAKKCGLSPSYITQIESGKKIINETAAASILKAFGETVETALGNYMDDSQEAPPAPKPQKPAAQMSKPAAPVTQVEVNDQWAGALSGIIKKFPIVDMRTGKSVGEKELPVLNKKIEGIPWEKLAFYQTADDEAESFRIHSKCVLWVNLMDQMQSDAVYLIERGGKKQICRLKKEYGQLLVHKKPKDLHPEACDPKSVKIVGQCLRVEFQL